jgi:signal transduction histidine kinase
MSDETPREVSDPQGLLAAEIAGRAQAEALRMRLLRRLVMAQEEERRRIARDLHDDLGQRLTALRLVLEGIARERRDSSGRMTQALEMLAAIDQGVDFIAWELRPAALDELGLIKVLETYVQEWSRYVGVRANFHAAARHGAGRFPFEIEASVYRIAQEALNNVAKHARASSVNVLLEQRGPTLDLIVEDDGVGFRSAASTETNIGLDGMRERAAAVGGILEIEPTPGGGTTVLARVPISGSSGQLLRPSAPGQGAAAEAPAPLPLRQSSDADDAARMSVRVRLQDLQQAVAARDEFIATVAHELRNPIAPLTFQLRLALEKAEQIASGGESVPVDWVQSQLRRVEQRLHRLLETLDRLLDVSRLSTGRIDLQPEPVNLAHTVRDVLSTFEAELAVSRCELSFSQRGETTGLWDRVRLEQICRNLISNAVRFGAGRPIAVMVAGDADFVTLEVCDHGVGIAPDQQARIFERFERGSAPRSGGFGIGLWLVRSICVAMGGTISVVSEPGEGACFTVMLPRSARDSSTGSE